MPEPIACWGSGREFLHQEQHTKSYECFWRREKLAFLRGISYLQLSDVPEACSGHQFNSGIWGCITLTPHSPQHSLHILQEETWHPPPTCCNKAPPFAFGLGESRALRSTAPHSGRYLKTLGNASAFRVCRNGVDGFFSTFFFSAYFFPLKSSLHLTSFAGGKICPKQWALFFSIS